MASETATTVPPRQPWGTAILPHFDTLITEQVLRLFGGGGGGGFKLRRVRSLTAESASVRAHWKKAAESVEVAVVNPTRNSQ